VARGDGRMRGGDACRSEAAAKGKQEVRGGGCALIGRVTLRGRGVLRG
jgi:hypothetical protein